MPANLTDTFSTDQKSAETPETALPSPTHTLQHLIRSTTPLSSPYMLLADLKFTEVNITSNQNHTIMDIDNYEGELYCMPISYGKNNDTIMPLSTAPCTPIEDLQVKHKATWKKIARLKQNSTTSVGTISLGKKRHSNHANNNVGQGDKARNKQLKGVVDPTQPIVQTMEVAA